MTGHFDKVYFTLKICGLDLCCSLCSVKTLKTQLFDFVFFPHELSSIAEPGDNIHRLWLQNLEIEPKVTHRYILCSKNFTINSNLIKAFFIFSK